MEWILFQFHFKETNYWKQRSLFIHWISEAIKELFLLSG